MATKNKNVKKPRKHKEGSGKGRMQRARRALRKLIQKIRRWENNQTNPAKKHVWKKGQKPRLRARHNNWDTAGLEKYAKLLRNIIKKGKTSKRKSL